MSQTTQDDDNTFTGNEAARTAQQSPLSGTKRSRPKKDHVQVPAVELTRESYYSTPIKSDRTSICWALQTETSVRLAKVKARGIGEVSSRQGNNDAYSTTLQSKYLLDVYLTQDAKSKGSLSPLARDKWAFGRKSHPSLSVIRNPDAGRSKALTKLSVEG